MLLGVGSEMSSACTSFARDAWNNAIYVCWRLDYGRRSSVVIKYAADTGQEVGAIANNINDNTDRTLRTDASARDASTSELGWPMITSMCVSPDGLRLIVAQHCATSDASSVLQFETGCHGHDSSTAPGPAPFELDYVANSFAEVAPEWRLQYYGRIEAIVAPSGSDCLVMGVVENATANSRRKRALVEVVPGLNSFLHQGVVPDAFLRRVALSGVLTTHVASRLASSGAHATALTLCAPGFFRELAAAGDAGGLRQCLFNQRQIQCSTVPFSVLLDAGVDAGHAAVVQVVLEAAVNSIINSNAVKGGRAKVNPSHQYAGVFGGADGSFASALEKALHTFPALTCAHFLDAAPLLQCTFATRGKPGPDEERATEKEQPPSSTDIVSRCTKIADSPYGFLTMVSARQPALHAGLTSWMVPFCLGGVYSSDGADEWAGFVQRILKAGDASPQPTAEFFGGAYLSAIVEHSWRSIGYARHTWAMFHHCVGMLLLLAVAVLQQRRLDSSSSSSNEVVTQSLAVAVCVHHLQQVWAWPMWHEPRRQYKWRTLLALQLVFGALVGVLLVFKQPGVDSAVQQALLLKAAGLLYYLRLFRATAALLHTAATAVESTRGFLLVALVVFAANAVHSYVATHNCCVASHLDEAGEECRETSFSEIAIGLVASGDSDASENTGFFTMSSALGAFRLVVYAEWNVALVVIVPVVLVCIFAAHGGSLSHARAAYDEANLQVSRARIIAASLPTKRSRRRKAVSWMFVGPAPMIEDEETFNTLASNGMAVSAGAVGCNNPKEALRNLSTATQSVRFEIETLADELKSAMLAAQELATEVQLGSLY